MSVALIGALMVSAVVSSFATPAFALGACGPNAHRNYWGRCVFGGQNQSYSLRRTGHFAKRMWDGSLRCL